MPLVFTFAKRRFLASKLDASPPLAGGPTFAEAKPTANSGRGNDAREFTRRRGYPSPKIAAASRRRFIGPPARGGLGVRCSVPRQRSGYQAFAGSESVGSITPTRR